MFYVRKILLWLLIITLVAVLAYFCYRLYIGYAAHPSNSYLFNKMIKLGK